MKKVKVGLLPLYVKLYDDSLPYMRPKVEAFYEEIAEKLEQEEKLEVVRAPICRLENEFQAALDRFVREEASAVITLHLAYSPSLESEKPLANCPLPILVLDTTPSCDFSPFNSIADIDYNHGIHGVQDMCSLLIRNGKPFEIFAGHYRCSDVCNRVANAAKAKAAAKAMKTAKVGIVGEPFAGMGDFRIPYDELKRDIGMDVVTFDMPTIKARMDAVSEDRVAALWQEDSRKYLNDGVSEELHNDVSRVSLAIDDWIKEEKLSAFSINFLATGKNGLPYMPFDRPCRAMAEGIGYAGEGDVMTAAFVGALLSAWPESTFAEMFCPDWLRNTVFLSHMGEYNLAVSERTPTMRVKNFPFTEAGNPFTVMAPMKGGKAVFLDLAPAGDGEYTLIAADGEMLTVPKEHNMIDLVHGWFSPAEDLATFLEEYSRVGGTHHGALVYGVDAEAFASFAAEFGWNFVRI